MKLRIFFSLLIFLLISACTINEPKLPVWDTDWTLYLPTDDFVMSEAIDDSVLFADTTNSGIPTIKLSVSDSTDWERVMRQDLASEGLNDAFTMTVGNLELDQVDDLHTDSIYVMDILPPEWSTFGDTIPPYTSFILDPGDSRAHYTHFESVHVVSGNVWLSFHNGMFLTVDSGLEISLFNDTATPELIGTITFDSAVAPGEMATSAPFSLADKTIINKLLIRYSLPVAGTDTTTVLNNLDKNGGFYTDVHMDQLVVDQAIAKIPDQDVSYQDSVALPQEDFRIKQAVVSEGAITLRFNNNIALDVNINVTIPDVQLNGQPRSFQTTIRQGVETVEVVDLSGYTLSNASSPGEFLDQLEFEVASVVGSNDQLVAISATDSVSVNVEADSLYFESFSGELNNYAFDVEPTESNDLDALKDIEPGIRLSDLEMRFIFENEIDFGVDMDLHIVGYREENNVITDSVHLIINETVQPNSVSGQTKIVLNESSSTPSIVDLMEILPTRIKFYGSGTVGGPGSIALGQGVRANFTIESPLSIAIEQEIFKEIEVDTLTSDDIDADTQDMLTKDIREASAELILDNGLPVGAEVYMYLAKNRSQLDAAQITASDSLLVFHGIVEAGLTGADGFVDQVSGSTVNLALSESELQIFNYLPLYTKQKITLFPTNGTVRIRQTDKIGIDPRIKLKYTVNPE